MLWPTRSHLWPIKLGIGRIEYIFTYYCWCYIFQYCIAKAGEQLTELHLNYDKCSEYPLEFVENKQEHVGFEIKRKMTLTKDKLCLKYNDYLTLQGIPSEAYKYCIGNRSALEWIVDQYQLKEDARSGIINNPNFPEDPKYIVKLIGKIVTVSIETVNIVTNLPSLDTN